MKRFIRTNRYQFESLESRRLLTAYTVDLGMLPGGVTSAASDINASGQVVGTVTLNGGNDRAFLWQNGVMTDLGTLGGTYSRAMGMNDVGQVVGQSASATHIVRAFLVTPEDTDGNGAPDRWFRDSNSDGKNDLMRDLGTLGGNYPSAIANDVNNLGQVVGYVWLSGSVYHAFRWQSGVMTDLGAFGGAGASIANTISDAGQVGGWFWTGGNSHAFLWKNGVGTDLGSSSGVTDINGAGQWVADSRVWSPTVPNGSSGTFATLGQLPSVWPPDYLPYVEISTSGQSINAAGQVAGTQGETFYGENGNGDVSRGIRWINGVPEELPLEVASAINDTGQIVGSREGRALLLANENFPMSLVAISGATVTEGHSGTTNAVFTVSLSKASTQTVSVQYVTADGTAADGDDYVATAGTLTFAPGQTSQTISVTVLGDRIAEYSGYQIFSEAFTVALSNSSNALLSGTPASGVIQDDEPRIAGAGTTVLEGNVGSKTALVTVSLSSAYDQPVTVSYYTQDSTAVAGSDYVATSGTVTFAPGQTTRQIPVSILGDRVAEVEYGDTEYVYVFLTNPSANASLISHGGVTIQDDEPRVIGSYVEVTEPATGTIDALLTVRLSAAYDQDVIVEYATFSDDDVYLAVAGSDYVATAGSVLIPAGQTSRTFTVPIIGDGLVEDVEYFVVQLTGVSDNAEVIGGASTVAIRDYDGTVKTWIGPASGGNWATAANWSPGGVPTASHVIYIAGSAVTLSASATVAGLTLTSGASLTFAAAGNRVFRTSGLSIDASSNLNLNDNDVIVDYTGASPIASIQALLASGYNGGAWNGKGIITSLGNAGNLGIGYAESATLLGPNGRSFGAQSVDGHAVLLRFTFYGDNDLDREVDLSDLGKLTTNYGGSFAKLWIDGDVDYDGDVDLSDLGRLSTNFGAGSTPSLVSTAEDASAPANRSRTARSKYRL